VLIEILQAVGTVEITGFLDVDPRLWKTRQLGIIVLGSEELLPKFFEDGIRQVIIGVGGEGAHVGSGACVRQGIRIGRNSVVSAGAAVDSDVPDDTIVVGVPTRSLRKVKA
jgi:hypothetical protein